MTERYEWDYPPTMRPRRGRRQARPLQGEILTPEPEPSPRIRVEVTHRYQPRRHGAPPAWIVPLVFIVVLAWFSPYALIVAIVMASVLIVAHPTIAFVIGGTIAPVMIIACASGELAARSDTGYCRSNHFMSSSASSRVIDSRA